MRKTLAALALSLAMLFPSIGIALAATVNWDFAEINGGQVHVYYAIDENSLQVDSFTIDNQSDYGTYFFIQTDGVTTFDFTGPAHSVTTKPINNFKFRRIPATDHDDPNSVRLPQGVTLNARWPIIP